MVWTLIFDLDHVVYEGDPFNLLDRLSRSELCMAGESECLYWEEVARQCMAEEGLDSTSCSTRFEIPSCSWVHAALGLGDSMLRSFRPLNAFVMPGQPFSWILMDYVPSSSRTTFWTYWSEGHMRSNLVSQDKRWSDKDLCLVHGTLLKSKFGTLMRVINFGIQDARA
jgi:hypothetical protein